MTQPSIKLEAFLIAPDGSSDYRFLIDDRHIKYVMVDADALPDQTLINFPCRSRVLANALPPFPPGDWNIGWVVRCPVTGKTAWGTQELGRLCQVQPERCWHSTTLDAADFAVVERLRQNVRVVTCPQFRGKVVYKFAPLPRLIHAIERETTVYNCVTAARGSRQRFWAPRFLGHVAEHGRIVGFVMEYIPGRPTRGEGDFELCLHALEGLHNLNTSRRGMRSWAHGGRDHVPIKREDFIIRTIVRNGRGFEEAVLLDYQRAGPMPDG